MLLVDFFSVLSHWMQEKVRQNGYDSWRLLKVFTGSDSAFFCRSLHAKRSRFIGFCSRGFIMGVCWYCTQFHSSKKSSHTICNFFIPKKIHRVRDALYLFFKTKMATWILKVQIGLFAVMYVTYSAYLMECDKQDRITFCHWGF